MQLFEKHRPRNWDQVVGQEKAIQRIQQLASRTGLGGRAYWIAGQSGTGKTTIARILAEQIADPFCLEEIDATTLTPSRLVEVEREARLFGLGSRSGRAYIVNEAHGLRRDTIRQLLVWLERIPAHVAVIFTTTCDGQDKLFEDYDDASPLLSRCVRIDLSRRDLAKPFAERARSIAIAEGLDGQPIEKYIDLAKKHRNNLRAMLSEIELGTMVQQ